MSSENQWQAAHISKIYDVDTLKTSELLEVVKGPSVSQEDGNADPGQCYTT